jgi:5-methylcytosine-specific restriction endonuclease McrA
MESVLLINASYEPLKVISWQRAISLFFAGKVEVLEEYDHDIRSISLIIKAPAVVRLLRYAKLGRRSPPFSRLNVLTRDNFECQYCGKGLVAASATLDHVVPRSKNGKSTWQNVVTACAPCNRRKGGRTPEESQMPLKKVPEKPGWLPILEYRSATLAHKADDRVPKAWRAFLST